MQFPDLSEIARLRKKLKLTQMQLAEKSGVSQSLIARIESGTVDPGYSKIKSLFNALQEPDSKEITAEEIMTPKVIRVDAGDGLWKAANKMKEHEVSQMPVFDGERIVGSISEKVILDQFAKGGDIKKISGKNVSEYAGEAFPVISPNTPLSTISALLENNMALIVAEKGHAKGVITKADLLKFIGK